MRHIFIVNPHAGHGQDPAAVIGNIEAACRRQGKTYDVYLTEHPGHAAELVRATAAAHGDEQLVFYACGGDGTLNDVASGVAALENDRCAFTAYPIGADNDYVKMFRGGKEAFLDLDALLCGSAVEVDYIQSDCGASINILSVGLDAEVAMRKEKFRALGRGSVPYRLALAESLLGDFCKHYALEIDGEQLDGEYTLVFVGNGRYYGHGFCPVPHARPDDGRLDVLLVHKMRGLQAAGLIAGYKAGRYAELAPYMTYRQAERLRIFSKGNDTMCINLDGEIVHSSHLNLRIAPGKLRFVVPRGSEIL